MPNNKNGDRHYTNTHSEKKTIEVTIDFIEICSGISLRMVIGD
jgi:hypothetical protein